jgi:arginine-tRNA-protein transferase
MQYKIRYRPLEKLGREGWQRLSDVEQQRLINATAGSLAFVQAPRECGGKDGMPLVAQPFRFND